MNKWNEKVVIIDFGGQYNQLIARRVREQQVYSEVISWRNAYERIQEMPDRSVIRGLILTGGPNSVYEEGAPQLDERLYEMGLPILGICYGMQLMTHQLGGVVERAAQQEYGKVTLNQTTADSRLFTEVSPGATAWMSHFDYVKKVPQGFVITATTEGCPAAAMEDRSRKLYAVQFHAEVEHTPFGRQLIRNFLYRICGCCGSWKMGDFTEDMIASI
ncbi:MAG: glutamine-hydrolyzing GMP synthase, partial [Bacillota bacterium]|nr:glutamine-hydrolyzing GMP synthase [Bacillota bacterium]